METENKVDGTSRRKFIKVAATAAYVAPLIASMPAHATFTSNGSNAVKPKRSFKFKSTGRSRKLYKFKRFYRKW